MTGILKSGYVLAVAYLCPFTMARFISCTRLLVSFCYPTLALMVMPMISHTASISQIK